MPAGADDWHSATAGGRPCRVRSWPRAARASSSSIRGRTCRPDRRSRCCRRRRSQPEAIDWLWPNWLACGKLHLLAGAAGTGKTTIALSLAASLSRGGAWPDGAPIEPADVGHLDGRGRHCRHAPAAPAGGRRRSAPGAFRHRRQRGRPLAALRPGARHGEACRGRARPSAGAPAHPRPRRRGGDRRQPQEHRDAARPAAGGRPGRRARLRRPRHHPPVEELERTRTARPGDGLRRLRRGGARRAGDREGGRSQCAAPAGARQVEPRARHRRLCLHADRRTRAGPQLPRPRLSSGASRWKARRAS